MNRIALPPFSVVDYTRDYVIDFIRHVTDWADRSEVASKTQLKYLCSYLESNHIGCSTIVVESDYVDRHYLEDYAEYYARCFPSHPRKCSRLHFFKKPFSDEPGASEVAFNALLSGDNPTLAAKLQEIYLGFVVVRPIPQTVFARICLTPYPALLADPNCHILTREVPVNLAGFELSVRTVPFIEQDKVVSACATSALWVALSAQADTPMRKLPSPSNITKSATAGSADHKRTFPTAGLSSPQILQGLRHFGLEPSFIWSEGGSFAELQAQIYSYVSHGATVIIGGAIYAKQEDERAWTELGSHLVCVTGYALKSDDAPSSDGPRRHSDKVSKLYVHDDRSGPFLRMSTCTEAFPEVGGEMREGYQMTVEGHGTEMFVPSIAIVGVYHKVRIPYQPIWNACTAFHEYVSASLLDVQEVLNAGVPANEKPSFQELVDSLRSMLDGCWDISVKTSDKIKAELSTASDFLNFNGAVSRASALAQNMPKYIWRCRFYRGNDPTKRLTDILFDATEIPQGNILIGYICYDVPAMVAWDYVAECIRKRQWQKFKMPNQRSKESIGCFIKFFGQDKNNSHLNAIYGPLNLPRRPLKSGETDELLNVTSRETHTIKDPSKESWTVLEPKRKYIWVINDVGHIVLGEDVAQNDQFKGHPTLIDGKPGRIAGELIFVGDHWEVNLRSRAYSGHIAADEWPRYLETVINKNLVGLDATAQLKHPAPSATPAATTVQ